MNEKVIDKDLILSSLTNLSAIAFSNTTITEQKLFVHNYNSTIVYNEVLNFYCREETGTMWCEYNYLYIEPIEGLQQDLCTINLTESDALTKCCCVPHGTGPINS